MKKKFIKAIKDPLFLLLLNGTLAHTVFMAVVMVYIHVPSDEILDSELKEIIQIFED
ncbi:MAG: hypothetical protein ACC657_04105 [Thiohalomonadales bacterium]